MIRFKTNLFKFRNNIPINRHFLNLFLASFNVQTNHFFHKDDDCIKMGNRNSLHLLKPKEPLRKREKVSLVYTNQLRPYSKQKEKTNINEEIEDKWGGPEAFKLILFLKDDYDEQINKNDSVLVFFSASWCPHCMKLRRPYGMAALMSKEANLNMVFATFDINYNQELAQDKGVVGIPLIKYYKNGKFVTNYKGKRTSDELFEFAKNPPKEQAEQQGVEF